MVPPAAAMLAAKMVRRDACVMTPIRDDELKVTRRGLSRRRNASITLFGNTSEVAMRITSKGQVTIPVAIREKAGLMPNTEVEFILEGTTVHLRKATGRSRPTRGERLVAQLRGKGDINLTTDEIMAMTRGE
jgi:AbrB family looped-hinge helix DNA binding protein